MALTSELGWCGVYRGWLETEPKVEPSEEGASTGKGWEGSENERGSQGGKKNQERKTERGGGVTSQAGASDQQCYWRDEAYGLRTVSFKQSYFNLFVCMCVHMNEGRSVPWCVVSGQDNFEGQFSLSTMSGTLTPTHGP